MVVIADRYKCKQCGLIINEENTIRNERDPKTPICPVCGKKLKKMCPKDITRCTCLTTVKAGVSYCPECGEPMCPGCGCHDVLQISRVTGYLQDVSGWNAGKLQELKDRNRYNVTDGTKEL